MTAGWLTGRQRMMCRSHLRSLRLCQLMYLLMQEDSRARGLPKSKPSRVTLPKGRRLGVAVPAPKTFQRMLAACCASASLLRTRLALEPPRLIMTFLPTLWHCVMLAASAGQLMPVKLAAGLDGVLQLAMSNVG